MGRSEILEVGAEGRVLPLREPVKVRRTVETMDDVPASLGLHVFNSFACALGESALPRGFATAITKSFATLPFDF